MELEKKIVCPLGCECQKVVDGIIEQCAWYVKLRGSNPQTGKEMDEYRCSMAWQPILMIEGNGNSYNIASSIQSLRNETVKRQDQALEVVRHAKISSDS